MDLRMQDIRKFWKRKNEEDERSGIHDNTPGSSITPRNNEITPGPVIRKFENMKYDPVKNVKNCEFDELRMCIVHRCVAEKICVKISKYKKNVGFVKETVIKLKCTGSRNIEPVGPEISAVRVYSTPVAPDRSQEYIGRLAALQDKNDCDWLEENNGKETRDVIGGELRRTL